MKLLRLKGVASVLSLFGVALPMTAWVQQRPYEYWGMHECPSNSFFLNAASFRQGH